MLVQLLDQLAGPVKPSPHPETHRRIMRHIVSVSSGIGSAFTWKLICDKYGPENVTGIFADVNGEHPDNYRFLAEVQYELGSRLIKLTNDGKTIWDVMIEQRFLANTRIDTCSKFLKREPSYAWLQENCDPGNTTVYLGIDWTEIHRLDRARPRWAEQGWHIESPLCEPPYYHKTDGQAWLDSVRIKRPALYDMGFSHANCGGGCVKAGIGQFRSLLLKDRKWYINWWEAGEEKVRAYLGKNVAILRDRRGGTTRPLPLRILRQRIDSDNGVYADEDEGNGCGVCFLG
jgi:Phosphoadenosine phosphosulfate reductase family